MPPVLTVLSAFCLRILPTGPKVFQLSAHSLRCSLLLFIFRSKYTFGAFPEFSFANEHNKTLIISISYEVFRNGLTGMLIAYVF